MTVDACLQPLLQALHWRGSPRQLAEAMLARPEGMDLQDLRNAMANLDFVSRIERTRLCDIDPRLLPCVFQDDEGVTLLLLNAADIEAVAIRGTVCFFSASQSNQDDVQKGQWFSGIVRRFETALVRLLALSLVLNLLALTPALFTQAVYDQVIATRESNTLFYFGVGIGLALLCDVVLRVVRAAALAHIGARLDFIIGTSVVRKLLSLPLAQLERAAAGSQIGRLREFENLRNFFVGPLALVFLELPFIAVFVGVIALIGGWIALVPIVLVTVLVVCGLAAVRAARNRAARNNSGFADHQGLLLEMLTNMRSVKSSGAEAIWLERFRERSAQSSLAHLGAARISALAENFAQAINLIAGAATLAIGAGSALNGDISVGALIASMALVWRALAPVQTLFVTLTRLEEITVAIRSLNRTMALPSEADAGNRRSAGTHGQRFAGRVTLQRVVLRYSAHLEPALAGVSFDINPGEVVAITGNNGSGKSTILKLVANLYQAQAGSVLIDGVDARQLNPADLRQAVAYMPQRSDLFSGSVAENLRLVHPTASDEDLRTACAKAGVLAAIEGLPAGFDTMLDGNFASGLVRKIAMARTFLMDAPIVLLDEPGNNASPEEEEALIEFIEGLRGRATVLLVTHRVDHVRISDRVIVLANGYVVHDGTPENLMKKLAGGQS